MIKYVGALAALALVSSAAGATVVTIDYSADVPDQGTVSGTLSFDTKKINLVGTQDVGAFKIFTYDSPSFLTSFNIYGTQLDSRYKLDFADLGAQGRIYDFYAPIEGVPLDINFLFVSLDRSVGVFPEFGYENFTQAQVVFVDQRNSQVIDGGVASFTVSYANSVPEPATWAMMIGGFGMIGGALRRRRPTHLSPAI